MKINLLYSIGQPDGGGGTTTTSTGDTLSSDPVVTYGYTLDGRRIGKNGSVKVKYLYDNDNVNYELYEDGSKARYTHPIASGGCSGGCGGASNVFTVCWNSY